MWFAVTHSHLGTWILHLLGNTCTCKYIWFLTFLTSVFKHKMCSSFPLQIFNKLHKNVGTHTERGMMEFMALVCLQKVQNYFNQIHTWHFNFSLSLKSVFRRRRKKKFQCTKVQNVLTKHISVIRYCQHNSNILIYEMPKKFIHEVTKIQYFNNLVSRTQHACKMGEISFSSNISIW